MTGSVRFRQEPSRLSQLIDTPGGLTVAVALRRAEANLEPFREPALGLVDQHIAALEALDRTGAHASPEALEEVHGLATAIIDCASPFGLDDVCTVASRLCDLVRDVSPDRAFDWRVPSVFARAMVLVLSLPAEAHDQRRQVLDGTAAILARKRSVRD